MQRKTLALQERRKIAAYCAVTWLALAGQAGPVGGGAAEGKQIATHEPSGFTVVVDTGAMSNLPATTYPSNTWVEGKNVFSNFSPPTRSVTGEWSGNISRTPDGTGLRVTYPPTTAGGNSPVRFGTAFLNGATGTGALYIRYRFRLSPRWTLSKAIGIKVAEPRTIHRENHVIGLVATEELTDGSQMWPDALLQFPEGRQELRFSGSAAWL